MSVHEPLSSQAHKGKSVTTISNLKTTWKLNHMKLSADSEILDHVYDQDYYHKLNCFNIGKLFCNACKKTPAEF